MYEVPQNIPEYCPFMVQLEQFHVIFLTLPVVLLLPTHLTPATTTFLQIDIQSFIPLHSKCTNYETISLCLTPIT